MLACQPAGNAGISSPPLFALNPPSARDVDAAFRAGVFCIGVATGKFTASELEAEGAKLGAGPDRLVVFGGGLADGDAVLRALGLPLEA